MISCVSIGDPSGMLLAFDLGADRVVHNVADPAPKRARVRRHRHDRSDHQAGDGLDRAAIGIGDHLQRLKRIAHIEELWRVHAGQEMNHFGENDQEQVHQYQNRDDLIRIDALYLAAQSRKRSRSQINQRIGSQGDRELSGLPIIQMLVLVSSGSRTVTKKASSKSDMMA